MPNNYGYGPTRNLNPQRLKDLNADTHATGNISSLVVDLGAAVLEKNETLHGELVARDADLFDGFGTFLAGLDDLNAQYGQGGIAEADLASSLKTWLNANSGGAAVTTWEAAFPNCFASNANLRTAMIGFVSAWTGFMAQWGALLSGYPTTTQGTFPRVITPRVKSNDLTADYTDMSDWFNALAIPGYGGIQINAAP